MTISRKYRQDQPVVLYELLHGQHAAVGRRLRPGRAAESAPGSGSTSNALAVGRPLRAVLGSTWRAGKSSHSHWVISSSAWPAPCSAWSVVCCAQQLHFFRFTTPRIDYVLLGGIGNPWGLVVATIIVVVVPENLKNYFQRSFPALRSARHHGAAISTGGPAAAPCAPLFSRVAAMTSGAATHLLEARSLTKNFGGVVALDHLDLTIELNEILGLIGPNGSGKTTCSLTSPPGFMAPTQATSPSTAWRSRALRRVPFITPACRVLSRGQGFHCRCRFSTTL